MNVFAYGWLIYEAVAMQHYTDEHPYVRTCNTQINIIALYNVSHCYVSQ